MITELEIIRLRDEMSLEELREITNETKRKYGFVDYRHIFMTMGYVHKYNDKWEKKSENNSK